MNSTLILSDLHHGRKHKVTYGDSKIWDYKSLNLARALIAKHQPKRVIFLGDIFDDSRPPSLTYSEFIGLIANIPEVWIQTGNHDLSKIAEPIAFNNLEALPNVHIGKESEYLSIPNNGQSQYRMIGWHPTQKLYSKTVETVLSECTAGDVLLLHASRVDFGNENDNLFTDGQLDRAKKLGITVFSGHDHVASVGNTLT